MENYLKIKNRIFFWDTIERIIISKNQQNFTKIIIVMTDGNLSVLEDTVVNGLAQTVVDLISPNFANTENNRISENGKFLKIKNVIWNLACLKEVRQRIIKGKKQLILHFKNNTIIIKNEDDVEDLLDLLNLLQAIESGSTIQNNISEPQTIDLSSLQNAIQEANNTSDEALNQAQSVWQELNTPKIVNYSEQIFLNYSIDGVRLIRYYYNFNIQTNLSSNNTQIALPSIIRRMFNSKIYVLRQSTQTHIECIAEEIIDNIVNIRTYDGANFQPGDIIYGMFEYTQL